MGKVIYLKTKIKKKKRPIVKEDINAPNLTKKQYLQYCKDVLEAEDYIDLLCGILDEELYEFLDSDMKGVVHAYYESL